MRAPPTRDEPTPANADVSPGVYRLRSSSGSHLAPPAEAPTRPSAPGNLESSAFRDRSSSWPLLRSDSRKDDRKMHSEAAQVCAPERNPPRAAHTTICADRPRSSRHSSIQLNLLALLQRLQRTRHRLRQRETTIHNHGKSIRVPPADLLFPYRQIPPCRSGETVSLPGRDPAQPAVAQHRVSRAAPYPF